MRRLIVALFVSFAAFTIVHNVHVEAKALTQLQYQRLFTQWVILHNKVYAQDEFVRRFNTFVANLGMIHAHNSGNHSYTLAMNQFGDMTQAEFKSTINGVSNHITQQHIGVRNKPHDHKHEPHDHKHVAGSVDWRTKGAVSPVKNQGTSCAASWAFATTGAIEGSYAIYTGNLTSLSEQQLIDCSGSQGNVGCTGTVEDSLDWVILNGKDGITGEQDYPYKGTPGTCPSSPSALPARAYMNWIGVIPDRDEVDLLRFVNSGPVAIYLEASQRVFQFYSSGVLDDASCGTTYDHSALVVGYGTDQATGKDYWIVKNSWGEKWGEQGYIRLVRNKNMCGVADRMSYAIIPN